MFDDLNGVIDGRNSEDVESYLTLRRGRGGQKACEGYTKWVAGCLWSHTRAIKRILIARCLTIGTKCGIKMSSLAPVAHRWCAYI